MKRDTWMQNQCYICKKPVKNGTTVDGKLVCSHHKGVKEMQAKEKKCLQYKKR